jgi:hypothetical protein
MLDKLLSAYANLCGKPKSPGLDDVFKVHYRTLFMQQLMRFPLGA